MFSARENCKRKQVDMIRGEQDRRKLTQAIYRIIYLHKAPTHMYLFYKVILICRFFLPFYCVPEHTHLHDVHS